MLRPKECFRIRGEITALEALNNDEVIYTLRHKTVKSFLAKECRYNHSLMLEPIGSFTTAIAFSKTHQLIAIANQKTIFIYDIKTKLPLQTIISYNGEVSLLHFVENSPYLIVATTQGRVMQYRYDNKASLARLCSFGSNTLGKKTLLSTYVSAIDSYEDLIAASGYGGAITLVQLYSQTHKHALHKTRARVELLKFLSRELLVATTNDALIHFYHLNHHNEVKSISSPIGTVTALLPIANTHYALLASKGNKLALLDTDAQKIFSENFVRFESNIRFVTLLNAETVIVALENNTLQSLTLPLPQHLQALIDEKKYADAFLMLHNNPILKDTPQHKKLEKIYNNLYSKALKAFIAANKKDAMALIAQFEQIPQKKEDVQSLLKAFEFYPRFKSAFVEKRYNLAYSLCENYPALKHTYQYNRMEKEFKEAFAFAQKQIIMGRSDVARDIIYPFITVKSKKELVKLLLARNEEFLEFLKAVQNKEYKTIEKLCKEHELFKQLPNYLELVEQIEKQLDSIRNNIYKGESDKAIASIKELGQVSWIKEELKELYNLAVDVAELTSYYDKGDFLQAYELLDRSNLHTKTELATIMEKHWEKRIQKAEKYALSGDIEGVKQTLKELILLKSRSAKIGDLLRLSFHTQIRYLLAKRSFKNAEKLLYRYIDIFGIDTECRSLMNTFEKLSKTKLAITHEQETIKPRDAWRDNFS